MRLSEAITRLERLDGDAGHPLSQGVLDVRLRELRWFKKGIDLLHDLFDHSDRPYLCPTVDSLDPEITRHIRTDVEMLERQLPEREPAPATDEIPAGDKATVADVEAHFENAPGYNRWDFNPSLDSVRVTPLDDNLEPVEPGQLVWVPEPMVQTVNDFIEGNADLPGPLGVN